MSNSIHVSDMTRTYHDTLKIYEAKNRAKPESSFVKTVLEKSLEGEAASPPGEPVAVSTKDMTMEEYKQYIYDEISGMYVHPSQNCNTISIHITDAGFEAMKNDPEYEKWVLDTIRGNFSFYNAWGPLYGGTYSVEYFGAAKEDYRGYSWSKNAQNSRKAYKSRSEDSFWERRRKRKKQLKKEYEEWLDKKALEKRRLLEEFLETTAIEKSEKEQLTQPWNREKPMSEAAAAYEASLTAKIMRNSVLKG